MMKIVSWPFLAALLMVPVGGACPDPPERKIVFDYGQLPKLSEVRTLPASLCLGSTVPTVHDSADAVEWFRLHLSAGSKPPFKGTISIRSADGTVVDTVEMTDLVASGQRGIWTNHVPGGAYSALLSTTEVASFGSVCIDKVGYSVPPVSPQAYEANHDRRIPLTAQSPYYGFGKSVADLTFQVVSGPDSGKDSNCTAFLVAPRLVMSNYHCVNDPLQLRTARAQFLQEIGNQSPVVATIVEIVSLSSQLDYALLRIDTDIGEPVTWTVSRAPHLIIIQHPEGRPKLIAVDGCDPVNWLDPAVKTEMSHKCDTSGGSSGSAVMDRESGWVAAVHHFGIEDGKPGYLNFGVRACPILNDVRSKRADLLSSFHIKEGKDALGQCDK